MRIPLYLHIGHPKCASSTIQAALAQNICALRDEGFLVANAAMEFPESGPLQGTPVEHVAAALARKEAGLHEVVTTFHELGDRLGDRFHKIIVSAESLVAPYAELLGQALRHVCEIHVVYYIRRQDDWLVSAWNQWGCKEGLGLTEYCERMLCEHHPKYLGVIDRWAPIADTLHVRPLHRSTLTGGNVVADFFAAIGSNVTAATAKPANTSLDLALLETFANSPFLFDSAHDTRLGNWLREMQPPGYAIEKATLGTDLLDRIHEHFRAENAELQRNYFSDGDLDEIFGKKPATDPALHEQQNSTKATMGRMRRVIGLQLGMLQDLDARVRRLESGGQDGADSDSSP